MAFSSNSFAADSAPVGSPACPAGVLGKAAVAQKCTEFTTIKTAYPGNLSEQLKAVLASPAQLALLKIDAKKGLYLENVNFLSDARKDNKTIYNVYIDAKSKTQVNLSAPTREKLDKLAASKTWDSMDFTEARAEISKMLANDAFRRFMENK